MFTSAECRAHAEQKLAQAERDERHRRRLTNAAQAWLILSSQMRRVEANRATEADSVGSLESSGLDEPRV
jgi:hypothetical protein